MSFGKNVYGVGGNHFPRGPPPTSGKKDITVHLHSKALSRLIKK